MDNLIIFKLCIIIVDLYEIFGFINFMKYLNTSLPENKLQRNMLYLTTTFYFGLKVIILTYINNFVFNY